MSESKVAKTPKAQKIPETPQVLAEELGVLYHQFFKLYDRWWNDRKDFFKLITEQEKLLKIFVDQLSQLADLGDEVKEELTKFITSAVKSVEQTLGQELKVSANEQVRVTVDMLNLATKRAIDVMNAHQKIQQKNEWKSISLTISTAIVTSLLIVWILIPKHTLPLTEEQMHYLTGGMIVSEIFTKLSPREQKHIKDLSDQVLDESNTNSKNSNATQNGVAIGQNDASDES